MCCVLRTVCILCLRTSGKRLGSADGLSLLRTQLMGRCASDTAYEKLATTPGEADGVGPSTSIDDGPAVSDDGDSKIPSENAPVIPAPLIPSDDASVMFVHKA